MTHLNPLANYLYRQAEDLRVLRGNNSVKRVDYDHNTGTFTGKRKMAPRPYIVMFHFSQVFRQPVIKITDHQITVLPLWINIFLEDSVYR